jgi:hypothetical protein
MTPLIQPIFVQFFKRQKTLRIQDRARLIILVPSPLAGGVLVEEVY